jgi:hypothetical protein
LHPLLSTASFSYSLVRSTNLTSLYADTRVNVARGLHFEVFSESWCLTHSFVLGRRDTMTTMEAPSKSNKPAPARWAIVDVSSGRRFPSFIGDTSDGSPAFLAPPKSGVRSLCCNDDRWKKNNYILGKVNNVVGYYHVETKEAHVIVKAQLVNSTLESEIAMENGCCGGRHNRDIIAK